MYKDPLVQDVEFTMPSGKQMILADGLGVCLTCRGTRFWLHLLYAAALMQYKDEDK